MAYGYWKAGVNNHEAAFHVTFRKNPFGGEFTLACGLEQTIRYLGDFGFGAREIGYLATLRGNDNKPLFERHFLDYLQSLKFSCDVDAMPEGTLVFPHEPLLRISGPVLQCQLLETALLNFLSFQSLIATKAARICLAAGDGPVIEFGLRRAQGPDGGLSASRAAFIGGCAGTSNLVAGHRYGIPVSGTQAHSWIMFYENETKAFKTYAEAMPNNCIFLVDTYNSLMGINRAIAIGKQLRRAGHDMIGLRLDSGDRVMLSIKARRLLDAAGFPNAKIVCSGDLDENIIAEMKRLGARIDIWGVGTKLATGQDDGALGVVYKLGAVRAPGRPWRYRIKLSDEPGKLSNPGRLQVRRFLGERGRFLGDAIYELDHDIGISCEIMDPHASSRWKISGAKRFSDLLEPIFRKGKLVYRLPSIERSRERARKQIECAPPEVARRKNPERYTVGLEIGLHALRSKLAGRAKRSLGRRGK